MELSPRDGEVVRLVDQFTQLSATHLSKLSFADRAPMPLYRCLHRLTEQKLLARIGRRPSGLRGGAGPYVYQLGPRGWWWLNKQERYRQKAMSGHALKVADLFVELIEHERAGKIKILSVELEKPFGDARADMYIDIGITATKKRAQFCLEVDLGTERPARLASKAEAYVSAAMSTSSIFPYVIFAVPDAWRISETERALQRLIHGRELFKVWMFADLLEKLSGI